MRSSPARALSLATLLLAGQLEAQDAILERILAVVDQSPILLSEVMAMERIKRVERTRAIELLVDESLMLREAARLPEAAASPEDVENAAERLTLSLPAEVVSAVGHAQLRRLARRQLTILRYVEFRFRPQLRVDEDAVRRAFEAAFGSRSDAPGFETAAPELRARLLSEALAERIEAWVRELRAGAEVRYNP